MTETIIFKSIGIINTEFEHKVGVPIQPRFGKDKQGKVTIYEQYAAGLKDLEGFSHIYLLFHLNRHHDYKLLVKPYLDDELRGIFATRSPKRPNGIGLSVVEIVGIKENIIYFRGVDILDATPLIDIKPCFPEFDRLDSNAKSGWYAKADRGKPRVSDDRF